MGKPNPQSDFIYDKYGGGIMIRGFNGKGRMIIPEFFDDSTPVVRIDPGAFKHNTSITHAFIPDGVSTIWDFAFSGCTNLKEVRIPLNAHLIGIHAFGDCSSLSKVNFASKSSQKKWLQTRMIHEKAFQNCVNLKSIKVPSGLIGDCAFEGCSSLQEVTIEQGVERIGNLAFKDCSSLKKIEFPLGLERFGCYLFYGCHRLASVIVNGKFKMDEMFSDDLDIKSLDSLPPTTLRQKTGDIVFPRFEIKINPKFS